MVGCFSRGIFCGHQHFIIASSTNIFTVRSNCSNRSTLLKLCSGCSVVAAFFIMFLS